MDWESSIASEMEASVLLGRQINLDKARQLAYDGKIAEMLVEAKKQAGGEAEFAKMSVVQREALGDALGLNASQMAEFVKTQDGAAESAKKFHWGWIAIMGGIGAAIGLAIAAKNVLMTLLSPTAALKTSADMKVIAGGGMKGLGVGLGVGGAAALSASAMGKERGGPVRAGSPYIVGEKRAELFVPGVSGNILPSVPGMQDGSLQWPDMGKLSDTLGGKLDQIASFLNQGNEDRNFGNRKLGGQIERSGGQF
jgi:hypothetical protein